MEWSPNRRDNELTIGLSAEFGSIFRHLRILVAVSWLNDARVQTKVERLFPCGEAPRPADRECQRIILLEIEMKAPLHQRTVELRSASYDPPIPGYGRWEARPGRPARATRPLRPRQPLG